MTEQAVLVTGGAGYIGSHFARLLTARGGRVVVVDDLTTGFRENLVSEAPFYQLDVNDTGALTEIMKKHAISAVAHFAGVLSVPESVRDPGKYYRVNTTGMLSVMEAVKAAKVGRLVFSSTCATYGDCGDRAVLESDRPNPASPYGWSKVMSERILMDFAAQTGLKYVVLRYFNVAGAEPGLSLGQRSKVAVHLYKIAAEAAAGKRAGVTVYGEDYATRDGTCIRDYVHVEDLADAHLAALAYLRAGGESDAFNCGYGKGASVKEVLAAIERATGRKLQVTSGPRRPGDVASILADCSKIGRVLGWKPRFADLEVIAKHAYEWEKKLT